MKPTLTLYQGCNNSESLLRQCQECGQVYLAGEPVADRIPRTCPNECGVAVLDVSSIFTTH
jgi:hypothetical protein